jgi:hypothetical protein
VAGGARGRIERGKKKKQKARLKGSHWERLGYFALFSTASGIYSALEISRTKMTG